MKIKSAAEIKIESDKKAAIKRTAEIRELLDWLELIIGRYIDSGAKQVRLFSYDHNVGKLLPEIRPILEESGYEVLTETIERTENNSFLNIFGKVDTIEVDTFVTIRWK